MHRIYRMHVFELYQLAVHYTEPMTILYLHYSDDFFQWAEGWDLYLRIATGHQITVIHIQ